MALTPVVLLGLFEGKQQDSPVKREEIDMPGHGREVIDLRERCVEKSVAEREFEDDAEINERVGDEIKNNVMPFEEVREPCGEWHDHWTLDAL